MADKKRTIIDFGLDVLRALLTKEKPAETGKKVNLEDVKLDDLKREKVRLDQEERKMLAELRDVENQKRRLFEEGVRVASEREQRVIARRIKEIDLQAQNMDRMMQAVSKQMRIINGLIQIKDRARLSRESGIVSLIQDIDLQDLILYIDKASVDGEFHMEKFDEILYTLEKADAVSPQYREDQDVLDIVKEMQMAQGIADNPEALSERFSDLEHRREEREKEKGGKREADEEEN